MSVLLNKILIIMLIMIFIYVIKILFFIQPKTVEKFNPAVTSEIFSEIPKTFVYPGSELTDDPLFSDVVFYTHDDPQTKLNPMSGVEKCLEGCKGYCVEFGITDDAYCYPYDFMASEEKYRSKLLQLMEEENTTNQWITK